MFPMPFEFTKKLTVVCGSLALVSLLVQAPANAQEFPAPTKTTTKTTTVYHSPMPLSDEMKKSMKPGIRYTVGSVKQKGWHKGLVKGNRNLGHYFWAPMNHMVHASSSTKTQRGAIRGKTPTRKQFHYIKPIHAALPKRPDADITPKRAVAKKVRYRHDNSAQRVAAKIRYANRVRVKDVSAKYSFRRRNNNVNGRLISKTPEAKVYSGDYGSSQARTSGYLTNKDAYGKIISD